MYYTKQTEGVYGFPSSHVFAFQEFAQLVQDGIAFTASGFQGSGPSQDFSSGASYADMGGSKGATYQPYQASGDRRPSSEMHGTSPGGAGSASADYADL